ncbi:glycosyltransferase 87 family protein [Streptomyces antimicrobicus]|uniref:Glycosyltransferase 87 family protein n=1 Tax=Streptomyces antimicrobicus TaxID=2883108 RepID=A0ABS8B552_9ACTN|nr:glycosyltransferase 87 family protein [Streptomyces antimicrobicus]MCB5179737.1 glycosyltransferase 87 family protein [Streptomyces antimicrobicus]
MSALDTHRVWGSCAAVGYLVAAAVVGLGPDRERTRAVAVGAALAGAVVVPLAYLVVSGHAQSEVEVIERAGRLMVERATPYLDEPRSVVEVTPYLPGMALLGMPRALLGADDPVVRVLGDARLWCAAVLLGCLWAGRRAFRVASRPAFGGAVPDVTSPQVASADAGWVPYRIGLGALVASPVVALPLAVSGVDLPLAGLLCLGLVLGARHRPVAAGLVLAAACSLKWTAWPAVPVAVALLAHRDGLRAAVRCGLVAFAGTALAVLPGVLLSPRAMAEQVLAFPTGRGEFSTPASSPLPGRLLAELGPVGWYAAVGMLLAGGLAVAVSLVVRPPRDLLAAADRLALGLSLAFLLAPAGRFGYLALPVLLVVWPRLVRAGARGRPAPQRPDAPSAVPALPVPAGDVR